MRPLVASSLAILVSLLAIDSRAIPNAASPQTRFTAKSAEAMLKSAVSRGADNAASEGEVLASALVAAQLNAMVRFPAGREGLAAISNAKAEGGANKDAAEARQDVALLARVLSSDEGTDAGVAIDKRAGILTELSVLGPFRDTGGGLRSALGPEEKGRSFADLDADYSWGSYAVKWRAVPAKFATASGVPLDMFVHPRRESCSFVASRITVDKARPLVVHLAATGQAALYFDGAEVGHSDDVHQLARFDRFAGQVDAAAGDHLIVAKTCSAALDDDGRVRIRITDDAGAPLELPASAKLMAVPAKAPKLRPLTTPLARTLAKEDARGALSAIVMRTLGGADDLKSPRAPGLLDAFTHDAVLDPDRLAFAAWLTPSAANRTGWYGRAIERSAGKDEETIGFVRRRLVTERLRARLTDWAYAGAHAANLENDSDDEALLLRAQIDEDLGVETLRIRALRALTARFPKLENAPSQGLRAIARIAESVDPGLALRARETLLARGAIDVAIVRSAGERDPARARDLARSLRTRIDDAGDAVEIASALTEIGDHEGATEILAATAPLSPNRPEVIRALAEAMLVAPQPSKDADRALALLARARELAPGEARIRAELDLRLAKNVRPPQPDEKYLVPSSTLLARRGGIPKPGDIAEVRERQLHWLRAVRMHPDKRVSQLIQYAREIVIAPRSQDELYENLPLEGDQIEILRARVHHRDGSIALPLEEHNEGTRPRVRWPELVAGDTVEVAIRTWTDGPVGGRGDPPFYFLDYAGSVATNPIAYNEVIVESPKQSPISIDVVNGAADKREEKDEDGLHVVRLIWNKPKTVADEPLAPQLTELVPLVVGSTFPSWSAFRAWYTEAVRGFTEPDAEVRRLAAELTKGKATRDAKLRAIFDFVSDQIRYVNYTSGEFWLPNRPHQLLARREGDCDDKAILLITLLRAVNIEAEEVLVQTRETGQPSVLRAKTAAAPLFDHGIAFLPGPNGGTYLDATSPQSRIGPLPAMDARATALRVGGSTQMNDPIVELPAGVPEDHGSDVDWTLTLGADGAGEIQGTELHSGDSAFYLRSNLAQEGSRETYIERALLSPWIPTVEVEGPIDFAGELGSGRARVKYKARSEAVGRREGNELVVPLSPSRTIASQLAPLVKRTLPVSLPPYLAPSRQRRALRIIAPAGFAWSDIPEGGKIDGGEFGSAELTVTADAKDPRVIVAKRSVTLDRHIIPTDKYAAWRTFLQRIDALMNKSIRLVPAGSERAAGKGAAK